MYIYLDGTLFSTGAELTPTLDFLGRIFTIATINVEDNKVFITTLK